MSTLLASFDGIVDIVTSTIGNLLYPLFSIIFVVIGAIQHVFYAFAGIGTSSFDGTPIYSGETGEKNDQGILYYLLQNELVKNMLISIALLALFLVVIFTTMAFIKNIYAAKPKGWKDIVGNAIKGLAHFVFLPVCVLLGVWLGNILLQAINGATSSDGSTGMERKLFIACAYNANRYRTGDATGRDLAYTVYITAYGESAAETKVPEGLSDEEYAQIVDDVYAESSALNIGKRNHVEMGYSLWEINYLVLIFGGIFMLYVLGSLAFAMVKRLFYIIILFIISPGVCALYPLDEGAMVKSWTGEVKKQVLSAYGAVAGLNIFFSIVPLIDKIELFAGDSWLTRGFGINDIVQIFILVCGLMVVKDLIGLISGFVGGDNAYNTGASVMKGAKENVLKNAGRTARVAGVSSAFVRAGAHGAAALGKGSLKISGKALQSSADKRFAKDIERANEIRTDKDSVKQKDIEKYALDHGLAQKVTQKQYKNGEWVTKDVVKYNKGQGAYTVRQKMADELQDRANKRADKRSKLARGLINAPDVIDEKIGKGKKNANEFFDKVKNSGIGKEVAGLYNTVYEQTGAKGVVDKIKKGYTESTSAYDASIGVKERKDINKDLEKLSKFITSASEKGELTMATDSIQQLSEGVGNAVAKQLLSGKLSDKGEFAKAMGLTKDSTKADIMNVDKILDRLQNYMKLINNSKGAARDEYLKSAIKFATDTDANGNDNVQKVLSDALKEFTSETVKSGKKDVALDSKTMETMLKATQNISKEIGNEINKHMNKIVAEVAKNNKKDK